jgi:hypothetical protein
MARATNVPLRLNEFEVQAHCRDDLRVRTATQRGRDASPLASVPDAGTPVLCVHLPGPHRTRECRGFAEVRPRRFREPEAAGSNPALPTSQQVVGTRVEALQSPDRPT